MKALLLAAPLALAALSTTPLFGDDPITEVNRADVTITRPVQVPGGAVLAPGTYTFVLDRFDGSRNIVEIRGENGERLDAIVLTTRATRVERSDDPVLTFYEMPAGLPPAVRGLFWPGDADGQEFLYPHSGAQRIEQASSQTVPEVNDQEYSDFVHQGFSNRYPGGASATGQSFTPGSNQPSEHSHQPGAHIVGDPGPAGR